MRSSLKIPILILSVILLFSQINNVYGACDASVTNCKTCKEDDNKKCTECNPTFFVIGDACAACGSDCDVCTSNTVCTTCTSPKILQSDKSCATGCKPKEFFDTVAKICTPCHTSCESCTEAGKCENCPANQLKDATSKQCVAKCVDGQFPFSATDCAACSNGCKTCEKAGECKTCPDKFFLNEMVCTGCKEGCATCENGNDCKTCAEDLFLQQDNKTCKTTCDAKFFKNDATNKCDSCHASCETCTKAGECDLCPTGKLKDATSKQCVDKCVDGQFNSSATDCSTCSNGCKTCEKAGECKSCLDKFFLNGIVCSGCKEGCATCENGNDCKTCAEGLFLESENKTCSAKCPDKFFQNSTTNKCEPCHSSCGTCDNSTSCNTCTENSFFLPNKPSLCDACLAGCKTCTNKTICIDCQDGFFNSSADNDTCTRKCVSNSDVCKVCDPELKAVCKECQPGYAFNDGLCTNCQPMTGSTKLTNSQNETQYKCRACKTENCKVCSMSENTTTPTVADLCSECIDGYFYDGPSKSCIKCTSPCATCKTTAANCQSCLAPTFVLHTNGSCVPFPCKEPQYYNPNVTTFDQRCQPCGVSNCLVCDKFNGQACRTCTGSMVFNQKTKACEDPLPVTSATCGQGAYLGFDGKCVCTGENQYYVEGVGCRIIDITSCGSCYISSRDACTPYSFNMQCNKGCLVQTTETATTCTQCKQLVSLETQEDTKPLRKSTPQFLDSNGNCQSCKEGCGVCSSLDSCTQCLPNFMMMKEKDGIVKCTKPTSQASLCDEGLLPSMASVYYLNADNSNQQIKLAELFDKEKQQNAFFGTQASQIAFAIGVYGQPLITGNEEDEKLRLYTFNETTKKLTFSFVSSDVAERQETDLEITIECLPCLYNCNKCDTNYYYDSSTGRCYLKCPEGYISSNSACEKITTQKPVIIKSTEIGQNGQFRNTKGIVVEAVIQEFSNETFSNYIWTITPISSVFASQITSAKNMLGTGDLSTERTLAITKEKLLAGVTYKLEVTFSGSSGTYKGSRLITPLPDAETISFESQGFPVNLIKFSATQLESGSEFEFSYTLSEIRVFQNTPWWFIVHADGIATQVSQFSNEIFKIKAPSVKEQTTIDVIFDITDGRVTYRTIRQILVKGSSSSTIDLKNEFQALKGINTTVYKNEESFSQLPRLLKNLKKIALRTSSSEANLMARIQVPEFLTKGSCETTTDCGGDPCERVDSQSQDNQRKQCVCVATNLGDFCQLVRTEATDYVPIVSDILIKVGNYLNQTGNARPNITDYPQFLVYLEILMNSIDFVNEKSLLAYAFILQRAQPMAKSFNDISAISIFYKRAYNYYWNRIAEFEKMEDKSISSQIEATLYNIARISIIQNAKWNINFQSKSEDAKIGSIFDGKIVYFDTSLESKNGNTTKKTFTDISFEYSFDMFKEAQVAGLFTATVDPQLFKNVKGVQNISSTLYKISMIDLTSDTPEEIKKTNVANGVKITFSNLPLISDMKRACAFYDDKEGKFVFDVEGNQGCVFSIPNKTEGSSTVPDNTKAECICNHNTIFGLSEYKARTTKRQDMNDSSRLTFTLSLIFMILFFTTF